MTEQSAQDEKWLPLSARNSPERAAAFEILHDGVPDWLAQPLLSWIMDQVGTGLYIESSWQHTLSSKLRKPIPNHYRKIKVDDYLDIIDCIIGVKMRERDPFMKPAFMRDQLKLDGYLKDGGSLFKVGDRGLEQRVSTELQATADSVFASGSRAAQYLRDAWWKAWSRNPDASGAYQDGVQAVEAAYKPIVSPDNKKTSLGTIISNVSDKPTKFRVRLQPARERGRDGDSPDNVEGDEAVGGDDRDNVKRIVAMLEILWKSQLRHARDDAAVPRSVSIEEAQDAVALATILVHLAQQGGFTAAR